MGSVLSVREQKALKPHLQGIEPGSLAAVIWDSINSVGVDDDIEKLGIHFVNGTEFEDGGLARVIFWDEIGASDMPRKVFLEVLLMVGEEIMQEYENNYDLETSTDLGTAVNKLQVAMVSLRETIDDLTDEESAKTYRERLDSGVSINEDPVSDDLIEEIRTRRGSYMWTNGEPESEVYTGRRQSKGIESVIERLPDLRRRYDKAIKNSSNKPLERVRQKIKILNMFQKGSVAPTAILEEDEYPSHAPSPNPMRRKSTLSVLGMTPQHRSRSRSNSVCSYESVSSNKQLIPPDASLPATSMPNMRKSLPQDQDSRSASLA